MAAKRTRAEIEAELAALDAEEAEEPDYEYEIGRGENYARIPSRSKAGKKLHGYFLESFGIDLNDEPVQDAEPEDEPEPKRKPAGRAQQGGNVRAFRGRGVG